MVLQTGRFLIKMAVAVAMQQPGIELPASASYLKSAPAKSVMVGEAGWVEKVFTAVAQYTVRRAVSDIMNHPDSGVRSVMCMHQIKCMAHINLLSCEHGSCYTEAASMHEQSMHDD
jgi:hypothetical protein